MEKESTRPALPYDYTCFANGTSFENKFLKGRLLILVTCCFTNYTILIKIDFLYYKKVRLYCIVYTFKYCHFLLAKKNLFGDIQPYFCLFCVHNNLF